MHRLTHLTRVAAIGSVLALAACETNKLSLLGPTTPAGGDIFKSYIAIGNSITAGYQSGGINDSTQRQSYALLLARAMGTQYHYPSLAGRGCTPPIASTQTGALVGVGSTSATCDLRNPSSVTDVLNNVAVPGARVLDPSSRTTVASNTLTTLFLGGKSQVEKALEANPTFATIWIGNNDVLNAGLSGLLTPVAGFSPGIVSTQAQFQASYDSLTSQLTHGAAGVKGVLIGVVQVAGLPSLSTGALLSSSAQAQAGINAATGKTVTIHPNCSGSTSLVNIPQLIPQIRSGALPPVITCEKNTAGLPFPVGDLFVLDAAEQTQLTATINGYNAYIKTRADQIGFAYYDPNPLFAAKRASGEVPAFPILTSATATFGNLISLDGVHPAAAAHVLLANELIGVINTKYGTKLATQ